MCLGRMCDTMEGMSQPTAIAVSGLSRHFGTGAHRVKAVDGIDLRIDRGEIVALLGTNGAGKTTTIDMILGLSPADTGEIAVCGESPRAAVQGGRISAVLQTGGLLSDLSVAETVRVVAALQGATPRVASVMDLASLTPIARRRVGKCSGGEQQRLKFALALLPDPDVLILDEPTAGMDVNARRRFWEIMADDAKAGRTIMFATHYLEEAEQFAERTVVMHRGRIVADGDTAGLRASLGGRVVSATLAEPAARDLLQQFRSKSAVTGATAPDGDYLGGRVVIRTTESDALARQLLDLGARDLEINAPTLEAAFSALTEE